MNSDRLVASPATCARHHPGLAIWRSRGSCSSRTPIIRWLSWCRAAPPSSNSSIWTRWSRRSSWSRSRASAARSEDGHRMRQAQCRARSATPCRNCMCTSIAPPQDRQSLAKAGVGRRHEPLDRDVAGEVDRFMDAHAKSSGCRNNAEGARLVSAPGPQLGTISTTALDRAAASTAPIRLFLDACAANAACGFYLVGGEMVLLLKAGDTLRSDVRGARDCID